MGYFIPGREGRWVDGFEKIFSAFRRRRRRPSPPPSPTQGRRTCVVLRTCAIVGGDYKSSKGLQERHGISISAAQGGISGVFDVFWTIVEYLDLSLIKNRPG